MRNGYAGAHSPVCNGTSLFGVELMKITMVVALLLGIAGVVDAQKLPKYPIEQFKLSNGMRVVLSEDHSAPVIGIAIAYDVGSRNEVKGKTGFAHLFEHLMFEGSAHVPKGGLDKYIEGGGGF